MNSNLSDTYPTGTILEIQRMSTEDGPGLRTTVFFKGCSLRCSWCHNPESLEQKPEIQWVGSRCILCKTCLKTCPSGALSFTGERIAVDRAVCDGCGACAGECPAAALELLGRSWSVEGLVNEVVKDASGRPALSPRTVRETQSAVRRERLLTMNGSDFRRFSLDRLEVVVPGESAR